MKCATLGKIRLTSAYNFQGHLSDFENVGANLYLFGKFLLSVRHLGANSMSKFDYLQKPWVQFHPMHLDEQYPRIPCSPIVGSSSFLIVVRNIAGVLKKLATLFFLPK